MFENLAAQWNNAESLNVVYYKEIQLQSNITSTWYMSEYCFTC